MSYLEIMVADELPAFSHASYITTTEPVRMREISSKIKRSPKKRFLNIATALATEFVKEEDVLHVTDAAEQLHLSPEAVAAQEAFLQANITGRCVYTHDY